MVDTERKVDSLFSVSCWLPTRDPGESLKNELVFELGLDLDKYQ